MVLHISWFFNLADSTSPVSVGPTSRGPIYLQFPHLVVLPLQAPHSRGPTFTASYLVARPYGFHIEWPDIFCLFLCGVWCCDYLFSFSIHNVTAHGWPKFSLVTGFLAYFFHIINIYFLFLLRLRMLHLALKPAHLISKNFTTHVLFFLPISPGLSSKGYPMTSISTILIHLERQLLAVMQAWSVTPLSTFGRQRALHLFWNMKMISRSSDFQLMKGFLYRANFDITTTVMRLYLVFLLWVYPGIKEKATLNSYI